jgi:O-methyltransferase
MTEGPATRYCPGMFAETAGARAAELAALEPAAIVNVDCDLYGSARDALALIGPKLRQGTVLLMDDWNAFAASPRAGERRALAEFLASRPDLSVEPWFAYEFVGQAFLVHAAR